MSKKGKIMYKFISFSLLSVQLLSAFTFTNNLGAAGATTIDKYNVLNRDGTYDKPTSFASSLTISTPFSANFVINGDLESGTTNWTTISGSGFVVATQSAVNNPGQYIWGSSTSGFVIQQQVDISSIANAKFLRLSADYSGWNSLDTSELKVSFLDSSGNSIGTQQLSGLLTGNKADAFQNYFKEIVMPTGTTKLIIDVEEIRNSGSDSDGYLDNISALIRPNKYYATNSAEHIKIPDFYRTTYYYGQSGNDLIEPVGIETWSERQRYNGNKGNDYIIMPVGKLNYASGNNDNDVLISYQGATLTSKLRLVGGSGDDKLYAPLNGTGHTIKGNSGVDMVVLRGVKDDYTFSYDAANGLYNVNNGTVYMDIYEDVEAVAFTTSNVMSEPNGNTNSSEDIWVFDTSTNVLVDIFPVTYKDNIRSVSSTKYPFTVTNDISGSFTMYLNGLPNTIIKAVDNTGNLIANAVTETNSSGDTKTYIRLPGLTGGQQLDIFLVDEQDQSVAYIAPDFSNIRITRGF